MYLLGQKSCVGGQKPAGNRRGDVSAGLQKAQFLRGCCTERQRAGGRPSTGTQDTPRLLILFCHKVVFIQITAILPHYHHHSTPKEPAWP